MPTQSPNNKNSRRAARPLLSIVIPAKNEEKRISKTLSMYGAFFNARIKDIPTEIIVVVNNSFDATAKCIQQYSKLYPFIKKIETPYSSGKGGAVALGFSNATGAYVSFVDADGAIAPSEVFNLFNFIYETSWLDGVIGNRFDGTGKFSLKRRTLARVFNILVKLLFNLPYKDTQCGAKVFKRKAAQDIAKKLTNTGWAFDVNLLLVARYLNFTILERPVKWAEKAGSKYKLQQALIEVPIELISLKLLELSHYLHQGVFWLLNYVSPKKRTPQEKNILIFAWRDVKHPERGGSEIYVHEIAKRLAKTHRVTLFTSKPGNLSEVDEIDGVKIFRKGGVYTVYIWAFVYYMLYFCFNTDFIIDVENGLPFFTPLYTRKPKLMVLHHVHKNQWFKQVRFPFSVVGYFIESALMPLVYIWTPVVTVSPSSMRDLKKIGFWDKNIYLAYNSIPARVGQKVPKSATPTLLYLGRVKAYKRLEIALDAVKSLSGTFKDLRLVIGGTGDHEDNVAEYVRAQGLQSQVSILGQVSEEEKWELMQQAWLFVMPSLREGWGITVLEAASCGTPCVGFDVPGIRDSIKDNVTGFLAEDTADYIKKVRLLIEEPLLRNSLGDNAVLWAKAFSWDKSTQVFEHLINKSFSGRALLSDKYYPWDLDLGVEAITTLSAIK